MSMKAQPGFAIACFLFATLALVAQPILRSLNASDFVSGVVMGALLGLSALILGLGIRRFRRRVQ